MILTRTFKKRRKNAGDSESHLENPSSHRHRAGQRMRPASALKPTRAEQKRQQKLLHDEYLSRPGRQDQRQLSSFEKLPVEIIHQIFFWCLETNLPNASLALSKALSNECIYRVVILFAYFDCLPGLPIETALFGSATFRLLDNGERCRLQAQMMKTRWCTLGRIKAAMPALSRLAMMQRWHVERLSERDKHTGHALVPFSQLLVRSEPELLDIAPLPDPRDTTAMKMHFFATKDAYWHQHPYADNGPSAHRLVADEACGYDNYLPFICYWSCSLMHHDSDISDDHNEEHDEVEAEENNRNNNNNNDHRGGKRTILRKAICAATTTLGVRYIPSWLLSGPWSWSPYPSSGLGLHERLEFLKLLRQGLRYTSTEYTLDISAEALFEGIKSAILNYSSYDTPFPISANPLVVLLELWWYAFAPKSRSAPLDQNISTAGQLPLELFHLAAAATNQPSDDNANDGAATMELLIRASLGSIPSDDNVLTAWALRMKAKGKPLGNWLLNYMTHIDAWQGAPVFRNGKWIWSYDGSEIFASTTFTQQVGYMIGLEASFLPVVMDSRL